MIFNIQRASFEDGPGIRTTVFMKGCPLRCIWCHNPESQNKEPELSYAHDRCIHCGRCVPLCPQGCHSIVDGKHVFDRSKCTVCGRCLEATCGHLDIFGYQISAKDLIEKVMEDAPFFEDGGGMTLSGGEPLYQPEFCMELLKLGKEKGLHICMETCGFCEETLLRKTAQYVDLYLFDYKESDPIRHKEYTGVGNEVVLHNLKLLDSLEKKIILRCPLIPNYNVREDHFKGIGEVAESLRNIVQIEIEPYHDFGLRKYQLLDRDYLVDTSQTVIGEEMINEWIKGIAAYTDVPVLRA